MESRALSKGPQGRLGTGYPLEDSYRAIPTVSEKGENGQAYDIRGGNERKNIDIEKELPRRLSLPETTMQSVADRPGHDSRYSLNCERIHRLNWMPKAGIEEGLQKTIDWDKDSQWRWRPLVRSMR